MSQCFTCLGQHASDAPCVPLNKPKAPGADDLWDEPGPAKVLEQYGPPITALYDGEDSCCGAGINEGDTIRADGQGGWIHDECRT